MKKNNTELYAENKALKVLVSAQIKAIEDLQKEINRLREAEI